EQLRAAIERLPAGQVMQSDAERPNPPPAAPAFTPPPPLPHIAEGSFFVGEDKVIRQMEGGRAEPVTDGGTLLQADGTMTGQRLARLGAWAPLPRPRAPDQDGRLARGPPPGRPPRAQPRLRPLRRRLRPDQQDDFLGNQ